MEYQKITNLLDNASHQPSKFRTKNVLKINDDAPGAYNTNSQIKFKTSMLVKFKSSQTSSQVYMIIVMHIHFLVEL